jgi:YD repeat-containing protein
MCSLVPRILALVALCALSLAAQPSPAVRFDGVYVEAESAVSGSSYHRYWRFERDSTCLLSGIVQGAPEKSAPAVAKWLDRLHDGVQVGKYTLQGTGLVCRTGDERAGSTYTVELTATGFDIISPVGNKRWGYRFVRVEFPAAATGGRAQNLAPRISDRVTRTTAFSYDAAGDLVGAKTTIVITATDAEGDPLTYEWAVVTGTISGNGPTAVWNRPISMGRPVPGNVTVTVTDAKGNRSTRTFSF